MKFRFLFFVAFLISAVWAHAQTPAAAPGLEFVMQLRVTCDPAVVAGPSTAGTRVTIPITGGTFSGPRIRGEVLNGGADYQLVHEAAGRTDLEALYNIRTDDGVTIHVRNRGIISGGDGGWYFFTAPAFEAPVESQYAWLNDAIYVCRPAAEGMPGGVVLDVWRVTDGADFDAGIAAPDSVPQRVYGPAARRGKVETFNYTARGADGTPLRKRARVYTPYGYNPRDKSKRHNVLYLMHGGGDNTTSFCSDPRSPLSLTDVLDHLIAEGALEPLIVVMPTFYPDDRNITTNGMADAIELTRTFHKELRRDLIPAVETTYNTWLESPDSAGVTASRNHRAFGGFSMGALATWYQLAYDNAAVAHYLPLSGDLWTFDAQGKREPADSSARWIEQRLKGTPFATDFRVYAYTGTDDIAGDPEKNFVRALAENTSLFRLRGRDANMEFYLKPGGKHYYGDINAYLYRALPRIRF